MNHVEKIKNTKEIRNIIFVAEGGLGKCIASTAIVKRLSEEFPKKKIIVVAGYPDVFLYNPRVKKVFNFNNPLYFYDDYMEDNESYMIKLEPYTNYEYISENKHLIDVWCDLIGLDSKGADPELFFLENEEDAAKIYIDKITKVNNKKKKFVLFQWIGGIIPKSSEKHDLIGSLGRMHKRSLPKETAQKIVNRLIAKDYVVGLPQHKHFPMLEGAERIEFPVRSVLVLLKYSDSFIAIDSFLQHTAKALNVKGVVCWAGTNPKKLGYKSNINLTREVCSNPFCHRPDSYTFDVSPNKSVWNCPFNENCRKYDDKKIVDTYLKLVKKKKGNKKLENKNNK